MKLVPIVTEEPKKPKSPLSWREFLGEEAYLANLRDYEAIRTYRKSLKGKPDKYDRILMDLNKQFESFYKRFLD